MRTVNEIIESHSKSYILSEELRILVNELEESCKEEGLQFKFDYTPDCLVGYLNLEIGRVQYDYQVIF